MPRPSRKRRGGLSKREAGEFRRYRSSIAEAIPSLLTTQLPLHILTLHRLILAFPDWPNTPPPTPDPPIPPYQQPTFTPQQKLDPSSYQWKPSQEDHTPTPHLSYHPSISVLHDISISFRPVLVSLSSVLHDVSHFLHLSLPAFDETSNSSLHTAQHALLAVRRQQRYVRGWLSCRVQYLAARGVMVEKCVEKGWEWNHVMALSEWDEREFQRWRNGMRELRGRMVSLVHLLNNNSAALQQHSSFDIMTT